MMIQVIRKVVLLIFTLACFTLTTAAQSLLDTYNVIWKTQSQNSGESMPCGGGDMGMNVWVEKGDVMLYVSRSGAFDENNTFPKMGRIRLHLTPDLFEGGTFTQELKLHDGYVQITGSKSGKTITLKVWADVFRPVVHIDAQSSEPVQATASYESWRTEDRILAPAEQS